MVHRGGQMNDLVFRSGPISFCRQLLLVCALSYPTLSGLALPLASQGFDATRLREPTPLAKGWLLHAGDDPVYALGDFDDSQWRPFDAGTESLHDLFKTRPEVVWYRLHLHVAPDEAGLALQEHNLASAFELYSNGVRLLEPGRVAPYVPYNTFGRLLVRIPDDQIVTGSVVIALRVYVAPVEWSLGLPGYTAENLIIGQEGVLREHMWLSAISEGASDHLDRFMILLLLLASLFLYSAQRNRQEYLWLFLLELARLLPWPLALYSTFHAFSVYLQIIETVSSLLLPYFVARTYLAFIRRDIGRRMQFFLVFVSILMAAQATRDWLGLRTAFEYALLTAPYLILVCFILPGFLIAGARRGNREAGILLIPLLLQAFVSLIVWGAFLSSQFEGIRSSAWNVLLRLSFLQVGPFVISTGAALRILSTLSLALIILLRSNRLSRQEAMLENEMANAREVQQVIMPQRIEAVKGFSIEAVYQPAQEVGGDFFQIIPTNDDGMLLVIGDVAGKGLPAAMLVAVLVGAIRTAAQFSQSPCGILAQLNERLIGRTRGEFSTALAALIARDGTVDIANAGHLAPYLDGTEVNLPSALPLGIVSGASYEFSRLHLSPGSRLTFYSDGVPEARSQRGELFGFERAGAISTKSASEIVAAAKQFGQADDITVVAIQRETVAPLLPDHIGSVELATAI